ncbi:diguanylate cyclase [Clostridiaceae bacterium UIB06]|uniref:Diguanylate cyclase n=1 Tax=Clostridium thailandense TaxID=2794346 RepID=A0A949WSH7_9CLOT|nr:diguanylate cyclase [Clostridium thailandense]MBV7275195.1 diguanylate cyclase [Clostridium thailandense]MCH5136831.1 diguanylate cyclase [Clostridiaceae bacterium UIB06]
MFNKTVLINYLKTLIEKDEIANTLLLTLKHKYYCVYNHCLNVSVSSYLLCYKMNMSIDESLSVALGGLLHDIGKLTIPSKILYKYETLNSKEWNIIKRHPVNGANLLSNSKYLDKVNNSILYHHERYDGKGYGSNLKGKDIPLHARIIGLCDSFDAMISYRSYRDTLSLEEAKNELIRNKNTQFDGYLIDNFLEIIDDYYTKYHNTESPLYIKDFISTKEDTDGGSNWETILDNLPDIGVILIDKYEQEKMLRLLERNIEYLNILVQGNSLLSRLYDLNQILKRALNVFNKIINIDYINIFIKRYRDVNFYNVDSLEGFTQSIKKYIDENIKEIFSIKEMKIILKEINNKHLVILVSPLENKNTAVIFIQTDIETEINEREEKLLQTISNYTNNAIQKYLFFVEIKEKAIKDTLTGLYNRQHLQTVLDSLDLGLDLIGVIVIDINNLKYINDTFGHLYGDLVIKTTAQILKKSVRESDYVFRYGGDEFMILALNCNRNYIKSIIRKIHINIASVWDKKQKNTRLTVSIGYSMSSKNIPINEIINIADENMYVEKNKFKNIKNYENEPKSIFSLK